MEVYYVAVANTSAQEINTAEVVISKRTAKTITIQSTSPKHTSLDAPLIYLFEGRRKIIKEGVDSISVSGYVLYTTEAEALRQRKYQLEAQALSLLSQVYDCDETAETITSLLQELE